MLLLLIICASIYIVREKKKKIRDSSNYQVREWEVSPRAFLRITIPSNLKALPAVDLAMHTSNGWNLQPSYSSLHL